MKLPPLVQGFVLHFGEMGSRWGLNRPLGQMYALLYVSPRPLNADDITAKLGISRSNVSMGLRELQAWRLVRLEHHPGDRREYFSAPQDVWHIFSTLAEERQRREIEPTLSMLREALLETPGSAEEAHAQARMREMYELMDQLTTWFNEMNRLPPDTLARLIRMGSRVAKLLEAKDRLRASAGRVRRRGRRDAEET